MDELLGLTPTLATWLLYIVSALTLGTTLCQLLFKVDASARCVALGSVAGLVLSVFLFSFDAVLLSGEWVGLIDREMLTLLWQSPNGDTLAYRVAGFALIGVGCLVGRVIAALGAASVLWSFAQRGHIAEGDSMVLALVLMLHMAVACIWLGILLPLRRLVKHDSESAADLGERFAQFAIWAVPALISAGLVMSVQVLGSLSDLVRTEYGQVLGLKLLAVTALLGLAALNKQVLVPRLRAGEVRARDCLVKSITAEVVAGLAILWATALVTTRYALPV